MWWQKCYSHRITYHKTKRSLQPKTNPEESRNTALRDNVHNIRWKKEFDWNVNQLSNLDHVTTDRKIDETRPCWFLTTCTWDALNANVNQRRSDWRIQKNYWLTNLWRSKWKVAWTGKHGANVMAWSYDMEEHANKCVESYCKKTNKNNLAIDQGLHIMSSRSSVQKRRIGNDGGIVKSLLTNRPEMPVFGKHWWTRHSLVRKQACSRSHEMDESTWQTLDVFDFLNSSYKWIQAILSCGQHVSALLNGLVQDSDFPLDLEDSKINLRVRSQNRQKLVKLRNCELTNSVYKYWKKVMTRYRGSLHRYKSCKRGWITWMILENFKRKNRITVDNFFTFPVNHQSSKSLISAKPRKTNTIWFMEFVWTTREVFWAIHAICSIHHRHLIKEFFNLRLQVLQVRFQCSYIQGDLSWEVKNDLVARLPCRCLKEGRQPWILFQ